MPSFGVKSLERLDTVDIRLRTICEDAIKVYDFSVLEGHRGKVKQDEYYEKGLSQVRWPEGKHNSKPSKAVDLAPYPVDWGKINRFCELAMVMQECAVKRGIKIRWGGTFSFNDYPHFELVEE